ncbi:MAG: flavodoxin [Clostridia bacterium]|nr:flavodoxin [Clostridia bacterium]
MKIAVVYYSLNGNTRFASVELARITGGDLIEIAPKKNYPAKGPRKFFAGGKSALFSETPALKPYAFDAEKYDLVVIGTPTWASSPAAPVRTFIKENAKALSGKKTVLLVCCAGGDADRVVSKTEALLGQKVETSLVLVDPWLKPSVAKNESIRRFAESLKD